MPGGGDVNWLDDDINRGFIKFFMVMAVLVIMTLLVHWADGRFDADTCEIKCPPTQNNGHR